MSHALRTDGDILRIDFTGTFTNQDLAQSAVDLARLEDASPVVPHRIADLRPVERLMIDFSGVLALAETRRQRRFPNQFKTAIIAADLVQYGFARMFQVLNDHSQIVIAIFGDDANALNWLRLPGFQPPTRAWQPPMDSGPS